MSEQCMSCSKQLGFEKHKIKGKEGHFCWNCKKSQPDYNNNLTSLRIGVGIVTVIAAAIAVWAFLS